jgi:NADPH-dependent glutamate synthase beta subunit-like oxidoreductase
MDKAPFPGVLGRVCTHPCESQCRRKDVNQAVSICALKRYAADQAGEPSAEVLKVEPDTGRKAAVVGSGPAGLTAAFFLRKKGHQVTVLEAKPKAGGMMRYGIPAYRLPEDVLDQEIDRVLGVGVELKTGSRLGEDFDLDKLKSEGYEAIFLALGLPQSRKIDLEGSESQGVLWGVDFLAESRQGQAPAVSGKVVVIGGGNVAVDVALTAKRLGADEVVMACLESREEMPANPWEIDMALEEGVRLMPSWGPRRILAPDGKVQGVELVACTSVFDDQGRFAPQFDEKTTDNQTADMVILAVGQMADVSWASGDLTMNNGLIAVDPESQAASLDGVFAGGDGASGPGALIEAIAAGRRAAAAMDKYLGGDGVIGKAPAEDAADPDYDGKRELGFADRERVAIPCLPVEERVQGFMEVDLCLGDDEARFEANRCLQCDLERALVNALKAANG